MKKHLRKKVRERDYDKRKSFNANRKSKHPPRESLKQIHEKDHESNPYKHQESVNPMYRERKLSRGWGVLK